MSCASDQTTKVARAAHETVIPTGQTLDDLRPAGALAHDLADAGIEPRLISFAVMKTTRRSWEGEIPQSSAYGTAPDSGRALSETPYPSFNERAELLARSILDRVRAAIARERAAAAR